MSQYDTSQLFFQNRFLCVLGLWDNSKRKTFFRISDQSESRHRNETPKAEQGSHGKGTGPRVSHCIAMRECQTPVEVKNFQSQKNFQLFFKTGFSHVSGLWDNLKRKKNFPNFRPI